MHPGHVLLLRPCQLTLQPVGWGPHLPMPGPTKSHGNSGGSPSTVCRGSSPAYPDKNSSLPLHPPLPHPRRAWALLPVTQAGSPEAVLGPSPSHSHPQAHLLHFSTAHHRHLVSPCPFLSMRVTSLASVPPRLPTQALSIRHSLFPTPELFPRYTSPGNHG